ncbi:MAG: DUF6324 family protein [Pseudomonadota bacterium]
MGIDSESEREATLRIGPTSLGMVRLYIESGPVEIPMDFDPEEAREIANELLSAADRAAAGKGIAKPGSKPRSKTDGRGGRR